MTYDEFANSIDQQLRSRRHDFLDEAEHNVLLFPFQDRERCLNFFWIVRTCHCFGLTQAIAIFIYISGEVPYRHFYEDLLHYAQANQESILGKLLAKLPLSFDPVVAARLAYSTIITERDKFYEELSDWLMSQTREPRLMEDLIRYQEAVAWSLSDKPEVFFATNYNVHDFLRSAYEGKKIDIVRSPGFYKVKVEKPCSDSEKFIDKTSENAKSNGCFLNKDILTIIQDPSSLSGVPFIRRRGKPLVSVLLPTRGRPQLLYGAMESILSMAVDPDWIEIIVKVDEDDQATRDILPRICQMGRTFRAWTSPRGRGYYDMHLWIDAMCKAAQGDWLFLFNDDARILTPAWDLLLFASAEGRLDDTYLHICDVVSRPGFTEFFFVRRKVFEILGHLSLSPHVDTWLVTIMQMVERATRCNIRIEHFNERLYDATALERTEVCKQTSLALTSPGSVRLKMADAQRLLEYIENFSKGANYEKSV